MSRSGELTLDLCLPQMRNVFVSGETTELSGKCIVGLAKGGSTVINRFIRNMSLTRVRLSPRR